jgi:hypothetical protein
MQKPEMTMIWLTVMTAAQAQRRVGIIKSKAPAPVAATRDGKLTTPTSIPGRP